MAINKNHEFDELAGVKCAIVERGISRARADFLKSLLELNGYQVVEVSHTAVAARTKDAGEGSAAEEPKSDAVPLVTLGVTDLTFNPVNAIFGRMLRTAEGRVVTLAYWQQRDTEARDDVPYFQQG